MSYHPPHSQERLTHDLAKEAMDELATLLKDNQPIKADEIIKAGSLGHGTAVPGHFDLDIVIYSSDVDAYKVLDKGYGQWLQILKRFLLKQKGVEHKRTTPHSVQFRYKDLIDVDLLVSPKWDDISHLCQFLNKVPKEKRFDFSVCASKWQVKFMENQKDEVKQLIQRAKVWRNKQWATSSDGHKKPKSYFLSLLVLKAYELASKKTGDTFREIASQTTRELKNLVLHKNEANIVWEEYYYTVPWVSGGPFLLDKIPQPPRMLDPANPANNLFETGFTTSQHSNDRSHDYEEGDGDWSELMSKIETIDLSESI